MQKLLLIIFLLLPMSIHAEEKSSFWSKTDEFLKKGADLISKKDKITGLRSLNTMSDKKAKKEVYLHSIIMFNMHKRIM